MQKKNNLSTILLVIMLLAGLSLLLYPTFSNWWNSRVSSYAVTNYIEQISNLDSDQYKEIWDDAAAHNASLLERSNPFLLSMEQETNYYQLLDVGGTGIMGYIEIPSLQVTLPLYHGTSESVLQVAVGHLEWTSLPVGGESTHCVLSGHRGLPSARLFTDLDKMMVGDLFMLHILDETLTYEVDQILIVYPEETEDLMIQEGKDLVTTFTAVAATINNIGPGLELVGPTASFAHMTDLSKCVLIFDMLAGRLELFPMLILFHPTIWKQAFQRKARR